MKIIIIKIKSHVLSLADGTMETVHVTLHYSYVCAEDPVLGISGFIVNDKKMVLWQGLFQMHAPRLAVELYTPVYARIWWFRK